MPLNNEEKSIVQVKDMDNGASECFSFKLPKGQLNIKHVEAYILFLQRNKISEVMKSLLSIYFTALNDRHFAMNEEERLSFEYSLKFLTEHTDEQLYSPI